jgi:hypothetical protein
VDVGEIGCGREEKEIRGEVLCGCGREKSI